MKSTTEIIALGIIWIRLEKFCSITGDTPNAVRCRVSKGIWKKGEIVKTINRKIHVNLVAYKEYCDDYDEKLAA